MKHVVHLIIIGAFVFSFAQSGYAQMNPPAAPAAPAIHPEPKKAKSKECSAKADEQKLHGKARKEYRAKCMAG